MAALEIKSEVAGTVWKLEKGVGDLVNREDVILVVESMKMEIPITAPASGVVLKVKVTEGEQIHEGQVVATIEATN